jgi:hypothetical protein
MLAEGTIEAFQLQAEWCRRLGSPMYGELLEHCLDDIRARGPVAGVLSDWSGDPLLDALALRLMGAVHRLVLTGAAPRLARFYPSAGGAPAWPEIWQAFRADGPGLHLRLWPGGESRTLARVCPHGRNVEWIAPSTRPA